MRSLTHRLLSAALITIISAAILLALAGAVLSLILARKVEDKLVSVNAKIGSLRVNLFTRGIRIKDFEWSPSYDSTVDPDSVSKIPHKVVIGDMHASGINLVALLRDKRIAIRRFRIDDGTIFINRNFKGDSTQAPVDSLPSLAGIEINRLTVNNIRFTLASDTIAEYSAGVGLVLHQLALDSIGKFKDPSAYTTRNVEMDISRLTIRPEGSLYTFLIGRLTFDKQLKKLRIDSLALQPILDKIAFARHLKSQETRTEVSVESITAEGVNMAVHLQDTSIMMTSILITRPNIWAYKDKRFPFTRSEKFPLPMEAFRALKIGVEVDTIRIEHGTITYEEFPEEGFRTGRITFDDVMATMSAVNNREFKNLSGYSTLKAKAKLMKTGEIDATFRLPLESKKKYEAEGTIRNVPLPELNIMLKPVAFVEIASGRLNRLGFGFSYDDVASAGRVNFDYEGLKILTLKKEKGGDVNALKSLVVNTAVKNDQTITGDIRINRNQRKAVFNLWAISLMDGIKSGMLPGVTQRERRKKEE